VFMRTAASRADNLTGLLARRWVMLLIGWFDIVLHSRRVADHGGLDT